LSCYSISVLLENGYGQLGVPRLGRRIENLVFITLAFMCILLGNLYKSIITTDMTAPILGTIPFESFTQLGNFTLLTVPSQNLRVTTRKPEKLRNRTGLPIVEHDSALDLGHSSYLPSYLNYLKNINWVYGYEYKDGRPKEKESFKAISTLRTDIMNRIRVFEYDEDALVRLSTCKYTAFVGSAEEIDDFLKCNQNMVKLGKGLVKFLPHNFYLVISYYAGGYAQRRMAALLSSGIWDTWKSVFYAKTRDQLDPFSKEDSGDETVYTHKPESPL
jgi:hypothetical protein